MEFFFLFKDLFIYQIMYLSGDLVTVDALKFCRILAWNITSLYLLSHQMLSDSIKV